MEHVGPGHRKRCRRWNFPGSAHYLTFSCFARRAFFRSERAAGWFFKAVEQARDKTPFELWSYVVMPEHAHLLVLPHDGVDISDILYQLKKPVTTWTLAWARRHAPTQLAALLDVQPNGKRSHRFWQRGGGYDRNLRSVPDVHEKIKYIHDNPVRRCLVECPGDWPWSSWRAWELGVDDPLPIDRDSLPPLVRT
jgi:putative transposase